MVKRILPHLASNRQFIRMFLDEARLAALLDHPNVVRIIEVGHDGEEYFLAMELVQGKPLSAVLRKARAREAPAQPRAVGATSSPRRRAASATRTRSPTARDARSASSTATSRRRTSCSRSKGAVKLIDFGVARAFGRVTHTSPGGLKGKIEYMSPEQASAEEVDHRADVFALGVVLWEVLTGRRLFRRETELATMRAILDDPIPRPSEIADVPAELDAVVMRALRKRRDARFASAHEMAQALERFAFSNEGFSPLQVASYMKGLFAAEFLQWRKTATAALDMEVDESDRHPRIEAPGAEPQTQGPTMTLRPGGRRCRASGPARCGASREATGHATPGAPLTSPSSPSTVDQPSRRDRIWVYGGLAALAGITLYRHLDAGATRIGACSTTRPPPLASAGDDSVAG